MGLFSKFKEANHKRNQTRNSIFLSTDSVTSNTSSETSNFKHPVSSNNKPKPKPRPKSEYYDIRKLPKARQEKQHSRSYSNQENELPLVGLSEDTLQFDANDISLDEVTEHLIDPQLFAVMDKKPRPSSYMHTTTATASDSRYNTTVHEDGNKNINNNEDYHSILDPRQPSQLHNPMMHPHENTTIPTEIPTEVQTPDDDLNQEPHNLILNQQDVPIDHHQLQETAPQTDTLHYDVNHLFAYPDDASHNIHKQTRPHDNERNINRTNNHQMSSNIKSPEPFRAHQTPQKMQLEEQPQLVQKHQQEQQPQQLKSQSEQDQRPRPLPLQFDQNAPALFNNNQMYQTSPQFYSAPAVPQHTDENSNDEESGSSEYTSSSDGDEDDDGSSSSGSSVAPTQHPYYEQWRRYYEALAAQQQQFMMRQQPMNPNSFPGFNPMMFYGNPQMMQQMQMQMQMQMPHFYNPTIPQGSSPAVQKQENNDARIYQQSPSKGQSQIVIPPQEPEQEQEQPRPKEHERKTSASSILAPLKVTPSPPSKRNSYVSVAHAATEQLVNEAPAQHDYLLSYQKSRNIHSEKIEEDNELISNSRRSTVKSNRYASAPLHMAKERKVSGMGGLNARVTSLEMNFKPAEYHPYHEDEEYIGSRSMSHSIPSSLVQSTQSLSQLKLRDSEGQLTRQISDYNKFLFDDSDDESEEDEKSPSPEPQQQQEEDDDDDEDEEDIPRRVEVIGHSRKHSSSNDSSNDQLPTPNSVEGLSRNGTAASAASYNSIESGASSKFVVADSKRRLAISAPTTDRKSKSKKKSKKSKKHSKKNKSPPQGFPFNPNMSMPELPMGSMMPFPPPPPPSVPPSQYGGSTDQFMMMNYSNPLLSQQTEYGGGRSTPRSRRQSISTTDSKRRSMLMETPSPVANKRNSVPVFTSQQRQQLQKQKQMQKQKQSTPPPAPPKVQDAIISKKIEQFIQLRSRIAAGNKTAEYRLHWVKMLITATNYKLYSYINIKGESIQPEQYASNKAQFIKSSVTHITKLIKEFASGVQERDGVRCEAYFIYASLCKQDYLISYNQDFNMEKNLNKAIEYYDKVLEINDKDFKALYKLGEIYEYDLNDFKQAVEYYTLSAKFGYNRAILKMAMFYLQEPEMRSIKYFKYLKNLSNIDLNEVQLDEEDLAEMEEVIGLACYELGKIFEGIYPGDLTTEDEFIKKSLELAPVNYAKSLTYYNKSAKLNCLLAQVRLGIVYERGELNRQENPNKSIQWYIKASSSPLSFRRHPDAMVGLARWCLQGSNGASKYIPSPVPDKAVMWCERAIDEFSSPDAMNFMGDLCEMGIAKGKAKHWFEKAYKLGNQEAGQKLGYF